MGETRAKKSKKASRAAQDASTVVNKKLEDFSLTNTSSSCLSLDSNKASCSTSLETTTAIDEQELATDLDYIEVRSAEGKGLAVFAARKIPAGTLILSNPPLIRLTQAEEDIDKASPSPTDVPSALDKQFASLPKPTQKSYLTLHDSEKSDFSKVKSIYYSNCYNLSGANRPSKSSPGGSCIGLTASRINHSCIPNAQFSFDEARNLMLFHAIKAIPRGREIVSNYDSVYEVKSQRQRRQMLYYGFRCDCEACEPGQSEFWARSDERRKGMVEVKRTAREGERRWWGEEGAKEVEVAREAVGALERLEALLLKEGIVGLALADAYRGLVKWTERLGDAEAARKWRRRELDVCVTCLGERAVRTEELRSKLSLVE